jgi:DNA-3-methyladenine glycosylase I
MGKARELNRCWWCGDDPLYVAYHDSEWGVPVHDDNQIFEFLILETFQSGLSWLTILRKRENFRAAFAGFDPVQIARFGAPEKRRLLGDQGIVRNRLKIDAAISNARAFLEVQEQFGSFDRYIWGFTGYRTLRAKKGPHRETIPTTSPEAIALSKDLKRRGFKFVGPTVVYAHMQATGMVDDHVVGCFRYRAR